MGEIIRKTIKREDKLNTAQIKMLEEMEKAKAKKKNAPKKKSGFMARLEAMQKEQQAKMREQIKEQSRKQYR